MSDRDLRVTTSVDLSGVSAGMASAQATVEQAAASMRTSFTGVKEATDALKAAQQEMADIVAAVGGTINEQNAAWGIYSQAQQQAAAATEFLASAQVEQAAAADTASAANDRLQYGMAYGTARIASYAGGVGSLGYALGSVAGRAEGLAPILAALFPVVAAAAVADIVYQIADGVKKWYDNAVLLKGQLSDLLGLDYQSAAQAAQTSWQVLQQRIAALRSGGEAEKAVDLLRQHVGDKPIRLELKIKQSDLDKLERITPGIRTLVNQLQAPDLTLQKASDHLGQIQQQIANLRDLPTVEANVLSAQDLERLQRAQAALENVTLTIRNEQAIGADSIVKAEAEAQRIKAAAEEKWAQRSQDADRLLMQSRRQLDEFLQHSAARSDRQATIALEAQRKQNEALAQQKRQWEQISQEVHRADIGMDRYAESLDKLRRKSLAGDLGIGGSTPKLPAAPFSAQVEAKAITTMGNDFSKMMDGVMMGTQRLSVAWRRMWAEMLAGWVQAMVQIAAKHLAMEVITTSQHAAAKQAQVGIDATTAAESNAIGIAATLKKIARDAAKAATGAYQAVAGIEYVGPFLAPPAAAGAYAGVMAFQALASAEGGQWRVPAMEQLTMLHRNEMVLPAAHAEALRNTVSSGGGQQSHNLTVNNHIHTLDSEGLGKVLDRHSTEVAAHVRRQLRARGLHA